MAGRSEMDKLLAAAPRCEDPPSEPTLLAVARFGRGFAVLALACLPVLPNLAAAMEPSMHDPDDFAHLRFLEGRWVGTAPDGSIFHEAYAFEDRHTLRSSRHADARFEEAVDTSVVRYENGIVTSTWDVFSWRAVELAPGRACFEPVQAPSSFCWQRVDEDHVEVVQRWADGDGVAQTATVQLRRWPAPG
ncbi:MAG: hypothetical protein KF823_02450 [Xanthomonadales bacterium]|nr:hypothetical protein [Xanthomonadales bacterium]